MTCREVEAVRVAFLATASSRATIIFPDVSSMLCLNIQSASSVIGLHVHGHFQVCTQGGMLSEALVGPVGAVIRMACSLARGRQFAAPLDLSSSSLIFPCKALYSLVPAI